MQNLIAKQQHGTHSAPGGGVPRGEGARGPGLAPEPMPVIFDTHAHYTSGSFNADRAALLASLPGLGVAGVVTCGTDLATSEAALALAKEYDWMYAAAGIHPESLIEDDASTVVQFGGDWRAELAAMRPLFDDEKVVAVGECGLDHHWPVPRDAQLEMCEAHIRLGLELELPVLLHDREAHAEIYALIKKYKPHGVLHAYSGSAEDVGWICECGMYVGFTGVVTFKNAKKPLEAAMAAPLEKIVLETDCPYMAPEPFRGKRSHSGMIAQTATKIAEARGMETDAFLAATLENAKALYRL